jgi:hypothetical protein
MPRPLKPLGHCALKPGTLVRLLSTREYKLPRGLADHQTVVVVSFDIGRYTVRSQDGLLFEVPLLTVKPVK